MHVRHWWNRVLRLTNGSQFVNIHTSYKQLSSLQLYHKSAASKTQNKQEQIFVMAAFCIFIGAIEAIISSRMGLFYHLFLHSLPLHNLLPMILHESGSQQFMIFRITGPRYVNLIRVKYF